VVIAASFLVGALMFLVVVLVAEKAGVV